MAATTQTWTVNSIKAANLDAGFHWFEPDTMRFFGTLVLPTVYQGPGGIFFVTSDKDYAGKRAHTVRQFDPADSSVGTVGNVASISTAAKAKLEARTLALGDQKNKLDVVQQHQEKFVEITVLEQFVRDLKTHGTAQPFQSLIGFSKLMPPSSGGIPWPAPEPTEENARLLIKAAYRHHYYAEQACSTPEGQAFAERNNPKVEKLILQLARKVGASGVIFSGDPRGCTVKLTFADGATNDFGKEGWCVPTEC